MLEVKAKAPSFSLPDSNGNIVSLSDFVGKKVVLYFYPKDNTPGCTRQACAFRDNFDKFKDGDIVVIGISKDSEESHRKFAEKNDLPFILLSDTNLETIKAYGVWQEKTNFGNTAFGLVRASYIVDEEGAIEKVFKRAKPDTNAEDILKYLEKL
ncbi:MAG: thioredoxin-dependent thiol peroxidase [Defluviitaleaceae bacterium]|nr:thioredoxin-dependent thiol peroxidase [Defluviitaleaceae bacterium]